MEGSVPARPRRSHFAPFAAVGLASMLGLAGCAPYIGTTAASYLRKVREDPDPNVRYLAYAKLANPQCYDTPTQKAEAVQILIEKMKKGKEPIASRAVICRTLGELHDPAARDAILKAVNDTEPVVRIEACRALGKVGQTEDATVLSRIMTLDTLEDCRIAAIEALADLKPDDARITRILVANLENDDPATRLAALNALRRITGRDLGVDPGPWQKLIGSDTAPTMIASKKARRTTVEPPPTVTASTTPAPTPNPAPGLAPAYPPQPPPRSDPNIDGAMRPAGYPPEPRTYLPR
jgi:hypothetical protein